jgi:hypothetical protein
MGKYGAPSDSSRDPLRVFVRTGNPATSVRQWYVAEIFLV